MAHDDLVNEHIKTIAEIDARSKSNTHRLDNMDKLIDMVYGMNKNIAIIAEQSKAQGEQLRELINTLKTHEIKIEEIDDKMETKDTVKRLHERIEAVEQRDAVKAEKLLNQVKWLLISLFVTGGFYLIWDKIIK